MDGFYKSCRRGGWHGRDRTSRPRHRDTGNVAFDDWRKAGLERIEEERRQARRDARGVRPLSS